MILLLAVVGIWLGAAAYEIRKTSLNDLDESLSAWQAGDQKERVLIVAPHCDDEILGCGGLISELVRQGAQVRVVIMTNGDGFYYAAARDFRDLVVPPSSYVDFGYDRQEESVNALQTLGVPRDAVTFLGYPDRGLAHMWLYNWQHNKLYESPYTRCSYSPYWNSYKRNAPYSGKSVLDDLESIIKSYRPTSVYYPHAGEQHPDHWATNCFVVQALYDSGMLNEVKSGLYIVHRGDWPVPQGLHRGIRLAPPSYMKKTGTHWYEYPLDAATEERKLKAIRMYRTQMPVLGRFLLSFVRSNEIFGTYRPCIVKKVEDSSPNVNDEVWNQMTPCVVDPVSDGLNVEMASTGDLRDIRCCYDDKNVYIRVGLANSYSSRTAYCIRLHGLPDRQGKSVSILIKNKKCRTGYVYTEVSKGAIEIVVPISKLGNWKAFMVSAESSVGSYEVDRTAWRLLLPEESELAKP